MTRHNPESTKELRLHRKSKADSSFVGMTSGVARSRVFAWAAIFAMSLVVGLCPGTARCADLGKDIERDLGKMVAEELEKSYGVVDDPLLTGWVDRLGQRLAEVSGRTDVKYRFKVLDSDEINAVAAPGGFIYVNRGILRFVHSEDELAAVMGHEVGHVAGKHAMKQLNAQLLGTLALIGLRAVHANTLSSVGGVVGGLAMLKFSRDEENDADRRGMRNAVATGYDGQAMLSFFRRLEATEKDKPGKLEAYFLTHPPTAERIRRVSNEPGAAASPENLTALAEGYSARSLYREAADTWRRAEALQPENSTFRDRIAESLRKAAAIRTPSRVSEAESTKCGDELSSLLNELGSARTRIADERRQVNDHLRETDDELESTARSLSSASQMITRRDSLQYKAMVRMARAFDTATRAAANLRNARDVADESIDELEKLVREAASAIRAGDGDAAAQAARIESSGRDILNDVMAGIRQARDRAGDTHSGARALHRAADSLVTSYRQPFGYTYGEMNILDVQVSAGADSLSEAATTTRRAVSQLARARMTLLVRRIDFLTRSVNPDDAAVARIVSHYLGVEPAVVSERAKSGFGEAALTLADEEIARAAAGRKKGHAKEVRPPANESEADRAIREGRRWENAGVLFHLMANDLERELAR